MRMFGLRVNSMLPLLIVVSLLIGFGIWLFSQSSDDGAEPLTHPVVRLSDKQIYCGDCSVNDGLLMIRRTRKTRLTTDGRCELCGGRSYVLAASYGPMIARRAIAARQAPEYHDRSCSAADRYADRFI